MNKGFGRICLVLAILFSLASIRGLVSGAGFVMVMPALVAVVMVIAGVSSLKRNA